MIGCDADNLAICACKRNCVGMKSKCMLGCRTERATRQLSRVCACRLREPRVSFRPVRISRWPNQDRQAATRLVFRYLRGIILLQVQSCRILHWNSVSDPSHALMTDNNPETRHQAEVDPSMYEVIRVRKILELTPLMLDFVRSGLAVVKSTPCNPRLAFKQSLKTSDVCPRGLGRRLHLP